MPPRLPRDLSGDDLIRRLSKYGFTPIRQSGSHVRLAATIDERDVQITVPRHRALRVGTLSSILSDVAEILGIDRDELTAELFD